MEVKVSNFFYDLLEISRKMKEEDKEAPLLVTPKEHKVLMEHPSFIQGETYTNSHIEQFDGIPVVVMDESSNITEKQKNELLLDMMFTGNAFIDISGNRVDPLTVLIMKDCEFKRKRPNWREILERK